MLKSLFSCCGCSTKPNYDIIISQNFENEKININPKLNKSDNQQNHIAVTTLTNTIPEKLKFVLTTKTFETNSPLFHSRKLSSFFKNNLKRQSKPSNNNNNSLSFIKLNNSFLSNSIELNSKNEISEIKDIENRKKLILSGDLFFGENIKLTPNGIDNQFKNRNERATFFGIENLCDEDGKSYNDFVINIQKKKKKPHAIRHKYANDKDSKSKKKNDGTEDKTRRVFKINYDKNHDEYNLIYLTHSFFLYYQIKKKLILKLEKNYYFVLGDIIMVVLIKNKRKRKDFKIFIKIDNNINSKKYFLSKEDLPINIGRANCTISIDSKSLSKLHCYISYSSDDGNFYFNDNNSTNGSILLVKEGDNIPIKGKMNFKLEETSFWIEEDIN